MSESNRYMHGKGDPKVALKEKKRGKKQQKLNNS
jgi:hypothetical protein